jgi:hypothetical protein
MAFCDYCPCKSCQEGIFPYNRHAQTVDGKWICDVCFEYDVCLSFPERKGKSPCDTLCEHRPKLISDWSQKIVLLNTVPSFND